MIGTVAVSLNRLPTAMVKRPGVVAGTRKAAEGSSRKVIHDVSSDPRIDIARRSGATADKRGLQTLGALVLLATLFVIVAGLFAMHHQPTADLSQVNAAFPNIKAGPSAASCDVAPTES